MENNPTPTSAKKFRIQYAARDYIFPKKTLIKTARFDDVYIHIELTDKRVISIPLRWIPTLYRAKPEERAKFQVNRAKRMLVWDPAVCEINEEIRIEDYLRDAPSAEAVYKKAEKKKTVYTARRKKSDARKKRAA